MITIHQRYRQTDRRHAIPRPRICTKVHCAVKTRLQKPATESSVDFWWFYSCTYHCKARWVCLTTDGSLVHSYSDIIIVFVWYKPRHCVCMQAYLQSAAQYWLACATACRLMQWTAAAAALAGNAATPIFTRVRQNSKPTVPYKCHHSYRPKTQHKSQSVVNCVNCCVVVQIWLKTPIHAPPQKKIHLGGYP